VTSSRIEAELKYTARDERPLRELAGVTVLGPARLGVARTVAELDRYLDTADLRLAGVQWACRLRSRDGRTTVSLKGPAQHVAGDPVHRRPELEAPADDSLDARAWRPSEARDRLLAMTGGAALIERFRLEQVRTERPVSVRGQPAGTLSLDRVRVLHGEMDLGRLLVVELEFGATEEAEADAAQLAAALGRMRGLTADPLSKFERALGMLAGA
jgi:inorganic triphosphatase YgiF